MPNFTLSFAAMGCTVQAWLTIAEPADAQPLQALPRWFEMWERLFSRFRAESELSALNRRAGQWVTVSAPLYEVITAALEAAAATDGLFNPLILRALEAAGYDHSFNEREFVPGASAESVSVPDWRGIRLHSETNAVYLPAHTRIDLGGIAKGWAAQQAALRLSAFGPCLVDAGGDMVAVGSPDETGGWLASIPNPYSGQDEFTVLLADAAIATSGTDYRQWTRNGERLHHIIDPRTGHPAESHVLSASVIAPDAVQAEVWAKAALIAGKLTDFPTLLITQEGSTAYNSAFGGLCVPKIN